MPLLTEEARRKRSLMLLAGLLVLVVGALGLNVGRRLPELPVASNLVVFALFNLNLIVLLLLLVLLGRSLVKLWLEQRQGGVGAQFKTKLVLAFLALSLVPTLLIAVIATNLLNKSIEGWFKPQVERPLNQAVNVAQAYYQNLQATALRHAQHVAHVIERDGLLEPGQGQALATYLGDLRAGLGLAAITVVAAGGREAAHVQDPSLGELPLGSVGDSQVRIGLAGQSVTAVRDADAGDLVDAVAPIARDSAPDRGVLGAVVVTTHVVERLEARVRGIEQAFREYKQLKLLRNPVKGVYILLFLLLALIVLFSTTWFGLRVARRITGPIEQLVEGTREVAAGNLSYKVRARADDELGALVTSFNRMTDDLAESKGRLEEAYLDLQDKHTELEERRRYIETVMEAVSTGVVSVDPEGRVTTMNTAAARMLGLPAPATVGRPVEEVFALPALATVAAMVRRLRRGREAAVDEQLELRRGGRAATLVASATALRDPEGGYAGAVVVLDDLTELLQAQRLAAWREVAQRLAHEIKNPLTPIQLSAQRLRRRLARSAGPAEQQIVAESTETIVQEVDALRRLVDEFSRFARMPALAPRPTDVRPLVEAVAALYRESHPALRLETCFAGDLPRLDVDPDHVKRAIQNLVDNAVEAVAGGGEVAIAVAPVPGGERVRIAVSDDGPGIRPEDRDKLFLPYFSRKTAGMGLGLSIVQQVVAEHGGSVRVEDNAPRGCRFVMELPVSRTATPVEV